MADEQAPVVRPSAPPAPIEPPEEPDLPFEIPLIRRSESLAHLATALALAQAEMEPAIKDSTNPYHKNKYASLASVVAACKPLSKYGIAYFQPPASNGGKKVFITTLLVHGESGEWIEQTLTITAGGTTPQHTVGAVTYGRRCALSAMTGVAPDDDDDGNQASNLLPQGVKVDRGGRSAVSQPTKGEEAKGAPEAERSTASASQVQATAPGVPSPMRPSARPAAPLSGGVVTPPAHSAPPPPPGLKPPQRAPGT